MPHCQKIYRISASPYDIEIQVFASDLMKDDRTVSVRSLHKSRAGSSPREYHVPWEHMDRVQPHAFIDDGFFMWTFAPTFEHYNKVTRAVRSKMEVRVHQIYVTQTHFLDLEADRWRAWDNSIERQSSHSCDEHADDDL